MKTAIQICLALLLVVAAGSIAALAYYGCYALQQWGASAPDRAKIEATVTAWGDAAPDKAKVAAALDNLVTASKNVADASGDFSDSAKQEASDIRHATLAIGRAADNLGAIYGPASRTLNALTDTVSAAQPVVADFGKTAQASTKAVDDLDAKITDPHVDALLAHLDATSAHVDGTTADVQRAIHRVTDPPPCKGRWCWVTVPGKIVWSLRDLPEPVYYLHELLH